jgi:hypothetical protein
MLNKKLTNDRDADTTAVRLSASCALYTIATSIFLLPNGNPGRVIWPRSNSRKFTCSDNMARKFSFGSTTTRIRGNSQQSNGKERDDLNESSSACIATMLSRPSLSGSVACRRTSSADSRSFCNRTMYCRYTSDGECATTASFKALSRI